MLNKEILRLAIPNILSNISVPLISTVDTILMGNLSALHLGAVGMGAMVFNFIYWNFGFLRMGTTGITAQAFGEENHEKMIDTCLRACITAIIIALLIIVFSIPIATSSFWAMNVQSSQYELIWNYFFIRLWAAPASLLLYAISGWYFGLQDSISPLKITLVVNVLNIIVSYFFVVHLGYGLQGVAWGTVIAQYVGLAVAISILFSKYKSKLQFVDFSRVWKKSEFFRFLQINRDIFFRTICLTTAFFFFYSQSSKGGEIILAVNVILIQLLNWMSYGIDGFAFASESLVGKYIGAKKLGMVNKAINYTMLWGFCFAIIYSLVFYFGYDSIVMAFNGQPEVLLLSQDFKLLMVLLPIVAFGSYMWDGIYVGLTASKAMRNSMFISFIAYMSVFYFLMETYPQHAIWIAMMVFLGIRSLIQWMLYKKYQTKLS